MSVVWLARDVDLPGKVVLKFLKPELAPHPDSRQRFIKEAILVRSLDHPNICTIYEVAQTESGEVYIAMAYYEGQTLREKIQQGPLPLKDAARIASQVSRGLAEAHDHSIVHRDIKPDNIIITHKGVVKILDFGLAMLRDEAAEGTRSGETAGTIAYMSPEQARAEEVDQRTDIWSLGVVLYEMLAGERPFQGEYPAAILFSILNEDPKPISEVRKGVPPPLEKILSRSLSKPLGERYQQIQEFQSALEAYLRRGQGLLLQALRLILPVIVLLVIVFGVDSGFRDRVLEFLGSPVLPENKRIAILPFDIACEDEARQQPFVEGLPPALEEELLALSQVVPTLRIIATHYLARDSAGDARRELGVNLVILGKLVCDGPDGAIDLSLVNAEDNRLLEKGRIEGSLQNRNELILRTKSKVREMLRLRVEVPVHGAQAAAPDLQGLYLEGKGFLLRFDNLDSIRNAVDRFQQVVEKAPDFAAAHADLSQAYRHLYRHQPKPEWIERSKAEAEQAISLDNLSPESYIGKGLVVLEFGQWEEALESFDRALDLSPGDVRALRGRAMALGAGNRLEEAVGDYEKAIETQPDDWAGYHELAKFYFSQGAYEKALSMFESARELIPESASAAFNVATAYVRLNRCDLAEPVLQFSLEKKDNAHAHDLLATCYYLQERYEAALQHYGRAVALDDSDWMLRSNLAGTYRRLGLDEEADRNYEEALRLVSNHLAVDPENASHVLDCADYLCELKQQEQSLEQLEVAAELPQLETDPWLMCLMGQIYEKLGKREEAIQWVLKAMENGWSRKAVESSPTLADLVQDPEWTRRSSSVVR